MSSERILIRRKFPNSAELCLHTTPSKQQLFLVLNNPDREVDHSIIQIEDSINQENIDTLEADEYYDELMNKCMNSIKRVGYKSFGYI